MRQITHVLLVEDDSVDRLHVLRLLGRSDDPQQHFDVKHSVRLQDALDLLGKGDVDVVLLDLTLPDSEGVGTVARLREHEPEIPVVVFTGAGDEKTALETLKAGAQDYLVKGEMTLSLLHRAICYAIERCRMATEARRLRSLLIEAEKRESLCVFSAGAAFGFNRLVGEILESVDQATVAVSDGCQESVQSGLSSIRSNALRISGLAEQLRDFAVPRLTSMASLDLSGIVLETSDFLETIVSPAIMLDYDLPRDLPRVRADALGLRHLLTNFVVNAAEAIGGNDGRIGVSTGMVEASWDLLVDSEGVQHPDPGPHVYLRVTDDGRYIEPHIRSRLFDPFFTTKYAGRGLGLSAAFGIARRHGGTIHVASSREEGTAFTLLLPPEIAA